MEIDGRHGDKRWQKTYADAIFYLHKLALEDTDTFDAEGSLIVNSQCTWLFQQSRARSRLGEIEKLLTCRGAGANLQYDQLAGRKVTLAITVNPEERPYYRDTWIKFDRGWKPCLPKEGGWIEPGTATFQNIQDEWTDLYGLSQLQGVTADDVHI